jgi:hypothetical protein
MITSADFFVRGAVPEIALGLTWAVLQRFSSSPTKPTTASYFWRLERYREPNHRPIFTMTKTRLEVSLLNFTSYLMQVT